jgi:hypothetical protein
MKQLAVAVLLIVLAAALNAGQHKMIPRYNRLTGQTVSYPEVSVQYIQEVHAESLLVANTLQSTQPSRWTLQTSPAIGDTVVITALCVVPGKVITFTNKGFTYLVADTAERSDWRGLLVRASSDTAAHILDGFLNVERGDVIRMTGVVADFPLTSMNSTTQFQPIPGIAIEIVGSQSIPAAISKAPGDFYTGLFPGGKTNYSGGEPYEGMVVEMTHLTVDARVNTTRGTFSMVDELGNQITMYDASKYFTLKGTSVDHPYADPIWTTTYPVAGTLIDTIRGFITTASGSENARGYRICPIYYGDVVIGIVLPSITTHRRNPIIVPSDSAARITCRVTQLSGGQAILGVDLAYSVDHGAYTHLPMVYNASDSLYHADIPVQAEGAFVSYFVQATDVSAHTAFLASSAFGGASSDTSKGTFFYTVTNSPLSIHDIQYTPYLNGRTPYLGAVTSVSGIVTADTANISFTALTSGGTNSLYMQSGNAPWSGIWITGPESTMVGLRNGDSVTVTGSIAENFDVTRIENIMLAFVHSSGNPIPPPANLLTGNFAGGASDSLAERYEGMLVRFSNVKVTDVAPTFSDATEYTINDNSGPVLVRRDGKNSFSNIPADTLTGKTILRLNDMIPSLTGIMYYSLGRYKIVPRTNLDFSATSVNVRTGWNMISVPVAAPNGDPKALFPASSSKCFRFTYRYVTDSYLTSGPGYWLQFPSDQTVQLFGAPVLAETVAVRQGWNLIGSIGIPIATSTITSIPPGMITSSFFTYNAGYYVTDSIRSGSACWVTVAQPGSLVLSAPGFSSVAERIRIVPTEEMPPPPPNDNSTQAADLPSDIALYQNYPNPFNPSTIIAFDLPNSGVLTLKVYNTLGQEMATLVNGYQEAGHRTVTFDASRLPSGVYTCRITVGDLTMSKKMLLMK